MPLDFTQYQTILLETFKRDGTVVNTPVWFVQEGSTLYVSTSPDAGKAKRLRNSPKARVAGADVAERPATEWQDATARFVDGDESARLYDALDKRYGGYFSRFDRQQKMQRVIIGLTLSK